jgi:hypothetical protein
VHILETILHFTVSELTDQFLAKSARIRNFTHFYFRLSKCSPLRTITSFNYISNIFNRYHPVSSAESSFTEADNNYLPGVSDYQLLIAGTAKFVLMTAFSNPSYVESLSSLPSN